MLSNQRFILAALESPAGVDANPTPELNALQVRDATVQKFQGKTVKLEYITAFLGNKKSLYVGEYTTISFKVDIAGAGTPGDAPAYGPLLRACAMVEKKLAAPVTGTAVAGTTGSLTLAVGASAVNDFYNDFLLEIVSGTGAGQLRRVKDYVGSTKIVTPDELFAPAPDATSVYKMSAQAVYVGISDQASMECISIYYQEKGLRNRLLAARGTFKSTEDSEGIPSFEFSFTGLAVPADEGVFAGVNYEGWEEPVPVNEANTPVFSVHGYEAVCQSINFDLGGTVVYKNKIHQEKVDFTQRSVSCAMVIDKTTFAEKNWDPIFRAGTVGVVHVGHGTVPGGIVHQRAAHVRLLDGGDGDGDGTTTQTINGECLYTDEGDDDYFIFVM